MGQICNQFVSATSRPNLPNLFFNLTEIAKLNRKYLLKNSKNTTVYVTCNAYIFVS